MQKFYEMFQEIEDPRADNSTHDLASILMISLLATISGLTRPLVFVRRTASRDIPSSATTLRSVP